MRTVESDLLTRMPARELAGLIRAREVSPVEAVEAYLRRIESVNPALNAVVTLAPDALEHARESEAAVMRGEPLGLLHGVPLTVKDTIDVRGLRTTCGSRVRAEYVPEEDAPAVARLRAAGAIILGKTNCPEFALDYTSENPLFGRTNNPHDLERTPGGSSGGCAAAVAACLTAASLGSDLAGSIRIPAHFCGVAGLKPTAGRVPGGGHTPPMSGLHSLGATLGPLARAVEDLELFSACSPDGRGGVMSSPMPSKSEGHACRLLHRRRCRVRVGGDERGRATCRACSDGRGIGRGRRSSARRRRGHGAVALALRVCDAAARARGLRGQGRARRAAPRASSSNARSVGESRR